MKKILLAGFILVSMLSYAQIVTIPDSNFKKALISTVCADTDGDLKIDADADLNNDGEIQVLEAERITILALNSSFIGSLEGINYFIKIIGITCYNNNIDSIDISNLSLLKYLIIPDNQTLKLRLNNLPSLENLNCGYNKINQLVLQNLPVLNNINLERNQLTSVNFSNLPSLTN
jgi:hypothetical protein